MEKTTNTDNEKLFLLFKNLGGDYCLMGATFLSEPRRTEEIEKALRERVENCHTFEAMESTSTPSEAAVTSHEPQSIEELANAIEKYTKKSMFVEARKIADTLFKNHQK